MGHGYIKTTDLRDGSVTTAKLGTSSIDTVDLAANAVSVAKLAPQLPRTLVFKYTFAIQGGAIAALTLLSDTGAAQTIPADALIQRCHAEVETAMTSAGAATVQLGFTGAAGAFMAAIAFNHATLALDSFKVVNDQLPIKVGAVPVSVLLTVGVSTLTAGVVFVYVEYVPGH